MGYGHTPNLLDVTAQRGLLSPAPFDSRHE
jgi:hypothetical protein